MKQTAVEYLIEQIKSKADNLPTNTKENRMVKGVYVDCLIMAKQAKEMEKQQQDEFAIGFAEWLEDSIYKENNFIKMDVVKRIKYTTKELLEIFKKEQFKNK